VATDNERLKELCKKVVDERDPVRFQALILELNQLLEKERKAQPAPSPNTQTEGTNTD
jgi:hypothetical protein